MIARESKWWAGRGAVHRCVKMVCLFVVFLVAITHLSFAGEVEFKFNPQDSTRITLHHTLTRVNTSSQRAEPITDVTTAISHSITNRTQTGWTIVSEADSIVMTRNGRTVDNPVLSEIGKARLTYHIDSIGHLLDVEGYGEVIERLNTALPPETAKMFSSILNEEALVNKEMAEWGGRIGMFAGQVYEVGEMYLAEDDFELPTGKTLGMYSLIAVVGEEECESGNCVRIEFEYTTDEEDVSALTQAVMDSMSEMTPAPNDSISVSPSEPSTALIGGGYRLIDPETMLIYEEEGWRTMSFSMESPTGEKIDITIEEQQVFSWEYDH